MNREGLDLDVVVGDNTMAVAHYSGKGGGEQGASTSSLEPSLALPACSFAQHVTLSSALAGAENVMIN